MSRKKGGVIGFDPLAWMKEGDSAPATASREPEVRTAAPAPSAAPPQNSAVSLGDTLTIAEAASMHSDLMKRLGEKQTVLDASALTRVDTAGLQLLASFVRTAEARGARIEWRGAQPALRESARRLGLEGALRLG
jgi:anti-anti-sigma regulatory factor